MNLKNKTSGFDVVSSIANAIQLHEIKTTENLDEVDTFIYIRVSTSKQKQDGNGLDAQLNTILPYCKIMNYKLNELYFFVDGGRSASNLLRPDYRRMMITLRTKKVQRVVISKRDRLIRNNQDLLEVRNEISIKNKCSIVSVRDGLIDWKSASEKYIQEILTAKDDFELGQGSERTRDCLYASALKGNYTLSHVPYGMMRVDKSKAIEPIPGREKEIEYGLKYIVDNSTLNRNIISHFNEINLLGMNWNSYKLKRFVCTNIYGGDLITPSFTIEDHTPAIVEKDLLKRAYETVCRKKRRERRTYIFRGYVKCNECGCLLDNKSTYKKNRNGTRKLYLYYFCPKCNQRMNQNTIINLLGSSLDYKVNNESLQRVIDEKNNFIQRRELCILENNQSFIDGMISEEIWRKELDSYRNEIKSLRKELNNLIKTEGSKFSDLSLISKRKKLQQSVDNIKIDFINLKVYLVLK